MILWTNMTGNVWRHLSLRLFWPGIYWLVARNSCKYCACVFAEVSDKLPNDQVESLWKIKKRSKVRLGRNVYGSKVKFRLNLSLYTCALSNTLCIISFCLQRFAFSCFVCWLLDYYWIICLPVFWVSWKA